MKDYNDEIVPGLAERRDRARKWGIAEDIVCGVVLAALILGSLYLWCASEGVGL